MIQHLSESLVALKIDGQKKTFMNSNPNRKHLIKILPIDIWEQILEVWGNDPYIPDETELTGEYLEKVQNEIIDKMKKTCTEKITKGISFYGERFSFEITDQLNIARLALQAKSGKMQVIYHANGKPCRFFTAQEIIDLNAAMENFIEYHTTYYNGLKNYIKTLKFQSELSKVYYGMAIPMTTDVLQTLNMM